MATMMTSPKLAASAAVPACAFGPSSSTRPDSVSGPRELLTITSCPAAESSCARVPPIFPLPMKPMRIAIPDVPGRLGAAHSTACNHAVPHSHSGPGRAAGEGVQARVSPGLMSVVAGLHPPLAIGQHQEVGGALMGDHLEALPAAGTGVVPPAPVGGPGTRPAGDRHPGAAGHPEPGRLQLEDPAPAHRDHLALPVEQL